MIELTRGFVAIIDASDFRRVNKHSWRVHFSAGTKKKPGQPYARTTIGKRHIYLHRFITDAPEGMHVDHLNHQTLDCRRSNLEIVCPRENNHRRRNVNKIKLPREQKIYLQEEGTLL